MRKTSSRMLCLLSLCLTTAACGVKSAPQPPLRPAPPAVVSLKAFPREDHILLKWSLPEPGEKLRQTQAVKFFIYRSESAGEIAGWTEFTQSAKIPSQKEKSGFSWKDFNVKAGFRYRYLVRAADAKDRLGPPSHQVETAWTNPPPAPLNIRAEVGDRSVTVIWNTPQSSVNITGYNIYRAEEGEFVKINEFITPATSYFDASLENGKKYSYQVRAVTVVGAVQVEGAASDMVDAVPVDNVSPQTPIGVDAFPVAEGVLVRWWRNEEEDLAGYIVYRTYKGKTERITPDPVREPEYLDKNVIFGQVYYYEVSAIDLVGNESPKSEPAKVYVKR